jgi:endoglucanase
MVGGSRCQRWLILAGLVAVATVSACGSGSGQPDAPTHSAQTLAVDDAAAFLREYVTPAGRVVRWDQGHDTVSEGQGYGLLLAYSLNDRQMFASVWSWTHANLQRPDGLFAYHWANGRVVSSMPAADADVQIAWALDLAGLRWGSAAYTSAARRIATAVVDNEVGYDDQGQPTVAAGPWAVVSGRPVAVEPGYWTYPADQALAQLTGDHRWQALGVADTGHLGTLTAGGHRLPADWARVGAGAQPSPASQPGGDSQPPQSGQDGLRAMVWAHCAPPGQAMAANWWPLIASTAHAGPLTRALSGRPATTDQAPLSDVAAAAAAGAAGHAAASTSLLAAADALAHRYRTYYGSAWTALGRIVLTTDLLPGCAAG